MFKYENQSPLGAPSPPFPWKYSSAVAGVGGFNDEADASLLAIVAESTCVLASSFWRTKATSASRWSCPGFAVTQSEYMPTASASR
jgi:hypothetical protein